MTATCIAHYTDKGNDNNTTVETQIIKYHLTHSLPRTKSMLIVKETVQVLSITLVNTQNVSVTNIVDSHSVQCAETKYGIKIQFLALVSMIHEVWLNE